MPAPLRLSVVIPTQGRSPAFPRVLDCLERQRLRAPFEVIVVSDPIEGDAEATARAVGTRPYPVEVIERRARGVSAARNAGWRRARAPLVLFIGDDILAHGRLLHEHMMWHERHPADEVGVLGHVRWARTLKVSPFMRWLDHGIQFDYPNIKGTEAGWGRFYTSNASVKRALLERVGGFDEEFPFHYEDLDLARRMHEHGFRLLFNRRARAEHLHQVNVDSWRRRVVMQARSERQFVQKYPEVAPYFFDMYSAAADSPQVLGRGRFVARGVPRRLPWLGPRVWRSMSLYYLQQLAPDFLAAWEEAEHDGASLGS